MKSGNFKKLCAIALSAVLGSTLLMGCGGSAFNTPEDTIVWNIGEDPKTIDPALNTSANAGNIILNSFEGLVRVDDEVNILPGVAETWDVSEDGLTYTFNLRKDAKWSDGVGVTANDFKYAWLRALKPETAAEYAYQLHYIKNAEAFANGEVSEEEVGIEVKDDYTLVVTLNNPTTYFLQLCAFATYQPVRQDIIEEYGEAWARSPETYISNGAFKMTEWKDKESIVLEKNENYWNASQVKLNKVDIRLVSEDTTSYAEFKAGNFDLIESVPAAEIETAVETGDATIFTEYSTYFLCLNVGNNVEQFSEEAVKALQNPKFREALSLAIDRQAIIDNITKGGQVPAHSFTAPGITLADGSAFDKEYIKTSADVEAAKEALAEAGYPNGEGLPVFNFAINSEGSHEQVAQYLQDAWKQIGVNVDITKQEFKVFITTRSEGNYMIARHGWAGDYIDPITFLDMWVTGGGNNNSGYSNPEYDELIAKAKATSNEEEKYELLQQAEEILMTELPVIPLYYYTKVRAINPSIKGLMVSKTGKVDLTKAYKEAE